MKMILLFCLLANICTSCNGQNRTQTDRTLAITLGETVSESSKNTWIIFQDKNNNYWFGSDGEGVYRYDGKTMIHFSTKDGLCNNRIREIKEDKAGNIYFTTLNGISKFDGQKFTKLKAATDDDHDKWKLEPDDLWFIQSNKSGPYRYDGKTLYSLEFPKSNMENEYYKEFPNTPINPYDIYYIYKDSKGTMWFGTGTFGIYRYDGKTISNLYEKHLTLIEGGGSFGIRSIMEDRKGKFWFCNTKYRYNILSGESAAKGKGFINYTTEKGIDVSNDPLGGDRIYFQSISEDSKGDLWMQTYQGGIWRYDGKHTTHYPVKDGVDDANVISMYRDKRGNLWLGTNGAGIYKFNGKTFEPFKF